MNCRFLSLSVTLTALLWVAASHAALAVEPRVIFATTAKGNGDLSSWADAGDHTGLAAADAICQARALAAGLAQPDEFVAWMSDSTNDAYCRVHGLNGQKAANCGQPSLPADAGPWVRTDGFPFGGPIGEILGSSGIVYAPVALDEFGGTGSHPLYFTGTKSDGTYSGSTSAACSDWTSNISALVPIGWVTRTTGGWMGSGWTNCSSQISLLCMQSGPGADLPSHTSPGALVFITSVSGTGDLSSWADANGHTGLAAADAICQARAVGLGDPTSFKAWLSDSFTDAVDRFSIDGPWIRVDGVQVAASKADLTDGQLFAPINVTESGTYLGNIGIWTGTEASGLADLENCDDWTLTTGNGQSGSAYDASEAWTAFSTTLCSSQFRLYCFSETVVDPIFADGFESGDSTKWSVTQPPLP